MKTLVLSVIVVSLLVIAGCTAPDSGSATTTTIGTPAGTPATGSTLPMLGHTTIGSGNKTIDVSIDSVEVDADDGTGGRTVTIYVAAHNTGTEPVMMVWFSKLTDTAGNSFGGINASHLGKGARTDWILPNRTEAARDFVNVSSNQDLAILSNGAVLDVYFMNKSSEEAPVSLIPDYHVAWTIDPGTLP